MTSLKSPRSTPNGFLNSQIVGRRIPIGTSLRPNARRNILGDGLGAVVRPPVEARIDMRIVCGPVAEVLKQNRAPPPFPWLVLTKPLPPTPAAMLLLPLIPPYFCTPTPARPSRPLPYLDGGLHPTTPRACQPAPSLTSNKLLGCQGSASPANSPSIQQHGPTDSGPAFTCSIPVYARLVQTGRAV